MIVKKGLLIWAIAHKRFIAKAIKEAFDFLIDNEDPIEIEYKEFIITVRKKI